MSNFNYYLNRQGSRGRQGVKGDKGENGYSPYIDIKSNTPTEFIMTIHNETESFDTPNLIPTAIGEKVTEMDAVLTTHTEDIANLKLEDQNIKNKNNAQDSDIAALKTRVGGTEESIEDLNHKYTVLGSEVSDLTRTKQNRLVEGANITLTNNDDGTTTISASGGGGGGGSDVPIATTQVAGKVKPDGNTITITDDGTISAVGGGGGTPANMVTTDTTQTITGFKTFTNNLHVNAPIASNGMSITCSNNSVVDQGLTIINEDMTGKKFSISVNDAGQANISGTTLNIGDVSLNTYVSGRNINMTTGDTGNLVVNTNNPIKVHNKTANTDDIVLVQGNIKAGDNVSLTKDTTTGDITISSTGGGGSSEPPANMVTTDTDQDIKGVKRFLNNRQDLSKPAIRIGSYAAGQDNYDGGYITTGMSNLEIGDYYATNSKGGFLSINSTADSSVFKITSNNSNINPRLQLGTSNYEGEIYNDVAEGLCLSNRKYNYNGQRSILKIKDDTLTFKKTDGTVVDLLAGGGGSSEPPANMVTTDTQQVITGEKGFTSAIKIMGSTTDNYYGQIIRPDGNTVRIQPQYGDSAGLNIQTNDVLFIDSQGISHSLLSQSKLNADEYYYKAGDVFTNESDTVLPGIFTSSKTQIRMSIPMPKSMKNVSNISVTKCVLSVRIPSGGYLPSASFDFLAGADTTITAYKAFDNLLTVKIDKTAGWGTQVPNNVPLAVQISPADLIVEFN